jgi:glutamate-5-semialdehyde dehydrogenase
MENVDTAAVYHNASTRLPMEDNLVLVVNLPSVQTNQRGPIGLQHLVTNKWYIYGEGLGNDFFD